ncbi:hypothetical protein B0H14DRAFT_2701641 [Mycena olivaceomarginata]|nr:hypothetical protein B0H14DRAFT_2701641 [Mycena olivaceomarginata]
MDWTASLLCLGSTASVIGSRICPLGVRGPQIHVINYYLRYSEEQAPTQKCGLRMRLYQNNNLYLGLLIHRSAPDV